MTSLQEPPTGNLFEPPKKASQIEQLLFAALLLFVIFFILFHHDHASIRHSGPFLTEAQARAAEAGTAVLRLRSLFGLAVFAGIAFLIGQIRTKGLAVSWRTVSWGILVQFVFAVLVLDTMPGRVFFDVVNSGVTALLSFATQGSGFVFGDLVGNNVPVGTPLGADGPILAPTSYAHTGAFFAFTVLPTIIFFCALSALLYHTGIMRWVIQGVAWVMQRSMRTSGMETLSAAANIFLGQTEAPLIVRPYIATATKSELMAILVAGFANIASGVMAAYVAMLKGYYPDIAGHLLAASIISAPSSLVVAKLLLPEHERAVTAAGVPADTKELDYIEKDKLPVNAIDATARGALDGLRLAANVGAVLIVFIAVIAMINSIIGWGGDRVGVHGLSVQEILGWISTPVCWLMGISWHDAVQVGPLLGIKTAVNEFVAYLQMADMLSKNMNFVSPRSAIMTAYALCGFANFSSVAIQVAGIGTMAPARRGDLARLGLVAMVGGAISSLMAACMVGVLL